MQVLRSKGSGVGFALTLTFFANLGSESFLGAMLDINEPCIDFGIEGIQIARSRLTVDLSPKVCPSHSALLLVTCRLPAVR